MEKDYLNMREEEKNSFKKENNDMNKRALIFGVLLLSVIVILGGTTYAFFKGGLGESKNQNLAVTAGSMALTFSDGTTNLNNGTQSIKFGESVVKELKIENKGSFGSYAKISWDNLVNTYLRESLSYRLEYKTSTSENWKIVSTPSYTVPRSDLPSKQTLADKLYIPAGETYLYRLTVTLENLSNIDQTADLHAAFSTKFTLDEGTVPAINEMNVRSAEVSYMINNMDKLNEKVENNDFSDEITQKYAIYMATINGTNTEYTDENIENIGLGAMVKRVIFETSLNPKSNAAVTVDLSIRQEGGVMGYFVPSIENSSMYDLYIQANGKIIAPQDCTFLFGYFMNLSIIEGLENFDTSSVTYMDAMFWNCSSLTSLDLGNNFNTSNVTNMSYMFWNCSSLTSLDLGDNFNTGKVTNMSDMFYNCSSLTSLDLGSNFNTSNVTNMSYMFQKCSGLTSLDLGNNFNTDNVTDMSWMFENCSSLTSLDLGSNFNTSNVTNMSLMFRNCSSLTSLDLGDNFNTGNVTSMNSMFYDCNNLTTTITIRGTKCTEYGSIFSGASITSGQITVNYTADAASLVDRMIATKDSSSNVIKGSQVV